jgi:hypothetical protein
MRPDDETIEDLAEAIASGRPVDAENLPAGVTSSVVANLIALSRLSDLHRVPDAQRLSGPAAGSDAETWGELRLLEKLGEGSFGEVYRAWDTRLHRLVALKLARARAGGGAAARSLEEGRLLAKVDHPNVVRVHGAGEHDGRAGLWMELVEGTTLGAALERGGVFPPEEAARVGADLCAALQAIHDADLVHGDVKAQNVIRESGGRTVLMDFGAGSRLGAPHDPADRTGTPMYTPPEVFAGEKPTPRSDLFSAGVLLFGLLTGRFPAEGESLGEVVEAHRKGRCARVLDLRPDVPAELAKVVEKAMAPAPEDRFRTAAEMGAALAAFAPAAVEAAPAAAPPRSVVVALAPWLAALAAAIALTVFLVRGPAPAPLVADARLLRGSEPAVQLFSGDRVQPGDLLHLRLDLDRESHVYVLNRDDRGALSLVFPMPGYALQNPLPPAPDLALPGPRTGGDADMAWQIGPGGGTERFLVIASREPLRDFEERLRALPTPGADASARALGDDAAENLYRGVTAMAELPAAAASDGSAGERLFALAKSLEDRDGGDVWVREFVLRNPAP